MTSWIIFLALIVAAAVIAYDSGKTKCAGGATLPVCSQPPVIAMCDPANLNAAAAFEGAAGNIYGTFSITNTSGSACKVNGDKFVQVNYDTNSVQNIDVSPSGLPSVAAYTLAPNAAIYALIHMPNGPQCSSAVNQVSASYTYEVDSGKALTFKDAQGNSQFSIQACSGATDRTEVRVTNMSDELPQSGIGL